ncbi:GHMP kinase [Archaeoglobales archaeon]|nr:MAG: GHMP kinase [Archaeoglobales archaeon]
MKAFCPASITAFFSTSISENPLLSGSYGVGFTINKGVFVDVEESDEVEIIVNGKRWNFPTVQCLINKLIGAKVRVNVNMELLVECGFGMSGATALATALSINKFFGLKRRFMELADIAHECEVVNKTGLGDVVCQTFGGLVVRLSASCPSKAVIERLNVNANLDFLVIDKISTEEVLKDELKRKRINKVGMECLKEFMKNPDFDNLFRVANKFSIEAGLMDDELKDVIEAVESDGGKAAMVMLGKAVFAHNGFKALKEFGKPFKAKISCCGAHFS